MPKRPRDVVSIQTEAGGCDLYSSVRLTHDLLDVSAVELSIGDDGSWQAINRIVHPGRALRVYLNGRLQFTGRAEENDVPTTAGGGSVAAIVGRTKLSDAKYASGDPKTRFQDVSIKQFILALYAPLGYRPTDFVFDATADRNLLTGERTGAPALVDLEPMFEGKAKVQPGEEIFTAAKRHLQRFHLAHWDAADGRIIVGKFDDAQVPLYALRCKRGAAGQGNNILAPHRIRDWSEVPSELHVFGNVEDDDGEPKPIDGVAVNLDVFAIAAGTDHFHRRLVVPLEGLKTRAKAQAQAQRELAARSKRKDAWDHQVDEWTWWNGQRAIPWAINSTVDVDVDTIGSEGSGRYFLHKLVRTLDTQGAATSSLSLAAPGIMLL